MNSVKCTNCGMVGWASAPACKRCGAALGGPAAAPSQSPGAPATRARPAHAPQQGQTVKPCLHCGSEVALSRWDNWNGFLVECPHCGGLHGKHWNIRRVLFAMRPAKALPLLAAFVALGAAGNFFLLDNESVPDSLEMAGAIIFVFAPMLVNAAVLVTHERGIDNSAPPALTARA